MKRIEEIFLNRFGLKGKSGTGNQYGLNISKNGKKKQQLMENHKDIFSTLRFFRNFIEQRCDGKHIEMK